jgi:tocopherol cyclase
MDKNGGAPMNFLQRTLKPEAYHGHTKKPPFFEGWYFKVVDAAVQNRYAIIPGNFKSSDPEHNHCFVQVLDGNTGKTIYHPYPSEAFHAAEGTFDIRVGPNHFTSRSMSVDIDDLGMKVKGQLAFVDPQPWPVSLLSPGIMGWYAWVPFMQTYHGVVSLDHAIEGELALDGRAIDFSGGRGYIEKDWGQSFPAAWVWFQSNHFEHPGTCITASIAIIPWVRQAFAGFIVGLWHGGRLYRFATYTGARVEILDIQDQQVAWVIRDRKYRLTMKAQRADGGLLHAPTPTSMDRRILETLNASIEVRLDHLDRGGKLTVFAGTGKVAGLEAVGDLDRLVNMSIGKTG